MNRIAIIIALLLLLGIVGRMDTEDEEAAAVTYCENVRDKVWPDYKGIYKKECKNISLQRLTQTK